MVIQEVRSKWVGNSGEMGLFPKAAKGLDNPFGLIPVAPHDPTEVNDPHAVGDLLQQIG